VGVRCGDQPPAVKAAKEERSICRSPLESSRFSGSEFARKRNCDTEDGIIPEDQM